MVIDHQSEAEIAVPRLAASDRALEMDRHFSLGNSGETKRKYARLQSVAMIRCASASVIRPSHTAL
jgi:hypothetical protein